MSDPERMLDQVSPDDELERRLLGSLRAQGPSDAEKAGAWQGIVAGLAAAGAASVAVSASPASAAGAASLVGKTTGEIAVATAAATSKALTTKLVLGLLVSGAVGGGALWMGREPPRAVSRAHVVAVQPKAEEAAATTPDLTVQAEVALPDAGQAACQGEACDGLAPARASKRKGDDVLLGESRLLTLARKRLREGQLSSAQAALERLKAKFPHGKLVQEREVLAIELLWAQGRHDAAKRKVRAFVATHPESPHSARLSRFLDGP